MDECMEIEDEVVPISLGTNPLPQNFGSNSPNPDLECNEPCMGNCGERTLEEIANMRYTSPHSQQISRAEYNRQAHYYTQEAVRNLEESPEYKKHTMKCNSCGSSWYGGEFSAQCKECGGYAMHRPCPICHGYCGRKWQRNVKMSHSMKESHWDGSCGHQKAAKLLKEMVYMDNITDAMDDLRTH